MANCGIGLLDAWTIVWRNKITKITSLAILVVFIVLSSSVYGQEVIKRGKIELKETGVSEKLNGNEIVPALKEDEGLIVLEVESNRYFDIEDVLSWLTSGRLLFSQIDYETGNMRVRPDGTIQFRFSFNFLQGQQKISRRVQISRLDQFENYYTSHNFYEKQVVRYSISVSQEPVFDEPLEVVGQLNVSTNIEGASISIINTEGVKVDERIMLGITSTSFTIPTGTYFILAEKSGYLNKQLQGIQINAEQETTIQVTLTPGSQEVAPKDEANNVILRPNMNGVSAIFKPLSGAEEISSMSENYLVKATLPPGEYEVTFRNNQIKDHTININVAVGDQIVKDVRLVKKNTPEYIKINSVPEGAEITVNGKFIGLTPYTYRNVEREIYDITLKKEYYRDYTTQVDLALINRTNIDKQLTESYVQVTSEPQYANVFINDKLMGQTPLKLDIHERTTYDLRVEKELYQPRETSFDLAEEEIYATNFVLNKKISDVTIKANDAALPVNLTIEGPDNYNKSFEDVDLSELELPYGDYTITMERDGFDSYTNSFLINKESYLETYPLEPKSKISGFLFSTLYPGLGQWYWGQGGRGTLFFLGETAAIGLSAYYYLELRSDIDKYNNGNLERDQVIKTKDKFLFSAASALSIWGLNMIDRLFISSAHGALNDARRKHIIQGSELSFTGNGLLYRYTFN